MGASASVGNNGCDESDLSESNKAELLAHMEVRERESGVEARGRVGVVLKCGHAHLMREINIAIVYL